MVELGERMNACFDLLAYSEAADRDLIEPGQAPPTYIGNDRRLWDAVRWRVFCRHQEAALRRDGCSRPAARLLACYATAKAWEHANFEDLYSRYGSRVMFYGELWKKRSSEALLEMGIETPPWVPFDDRYSHLVS